MTQKTGKKYEVIIGEIHYNHKETPPIATIKKAEKIIYTDTLEHAETIGFYSGKDYIIPTVFTGEIKSEADEEIDFPRGIAAWVNTHHDISTAIEALKDEKMGIGRSLLAIRSEEKRNAVSRHLAKRWADEFEYINQQHQQSEGQVDMIEEFIEQKQQKFFERSKTLAKGYETL